MTRLLIQEKRRRQTRRADLKIRKIKEESPWGGRQVDIKATPAFWPHVWVGKAFRYCYTYLMLVEGVLRLVGPMECSWCRVMSLGARVERLDVWRESVRERTLRSLPSLLSGVLKRGTRA